jgi:hypothetical protein
VTAPTKTAASAPADKASVVPAPRPTRASRTLPFGPGTCALTVDPGQPEAGTNYQTIQHAVDALPNPGPCTVTVKAGTYHEDVEIKSKNSLATTEA